MAIKYIVIKENINGTETPIDSMKCRLFTNEEKLKEYLKHEEGVRVDGSMYNHNPLQRCKVFKVDKEVGYEVNKVQKQETIIVHDYEVKLEE